MNQSYVKVGSISHQYGFSKMVQQPTQQGHPMSVLQQIFPQHIISRAGDVPWPARSPELPACDYFFWGGTSKAVLISRTIAELRQSIKEEITAIPEQMTCRMMENVGNKTEAVFEKRWETSE
jgi:hypothetical protein